MTDPPQPLYSFEGTKKNELGLRPRLRCCSFLPPQASAALDRFSSQTERDALDAEAVDTHLSVGSAAESTPAADESKPRSRSSDDASGSVLVDAAPNACQEEPRSSPSGDIQVRSESTATGGDENGRERGSPARRVSRFHRGPRGSWLPNLKAQMDAVKAKV